jgi:hypothetical protein
MKKIRQGVFETNSSSTHSITIKDITVLDNKTNIDNNRVLHLYNALKPVTFSSNYSGEIRTTSCTTLEQKLALVILYILNADYWGITYKNPEIKEETIKDQLLNILYNEFNIKGINDVKIDMFHTIYGYDENGDNSFSAESMEEYRSILQKFIEIIKDDTKQIIDSYESNE